MSPWLRLLRPAHWIKNLVCLAGVLFSINSGDNSHQHSA